MSNEYLVVLSIDRMSFGDRYQRSELLPLHCTVMPWFSLSRNFTAENLIVQLRSLSREIKTNGIHLVSEKAEMFGSKGDVPVHVLRCVPELYRLHKKVLALLTQTTSLPDESQQVWIGRNYRPHVTDTKFRTFSEGAFHIARNLIVVKREKSRGKRVIAVIPLG